MSASPTGPERRAIAQLQMGLFSLIVIVSGLVGTFAAVLLVFELSGHAFDIGGVGRDLSTFGLSALPVSLLSIAVAYAPLDESGLPARPRALRSCDSRGTPSDGRLSCALVSPSVTRQTTRTSSLLRP